MTAALSPSVGGLKFLDPWFFDRKFCVAGIPETDSKE